MLAKSSVAARNLEASENKVQNASLGVERESECIVDGSEQERDVTHEDSGIIVSTGR